MTPQPSTSSGISKDAAVSSGNDDTGPGPIQEPIASTSGSAVRKRQKKKNKVFINLNRASVEQCQQLFGATCLVKLQRCDQAPSAMIPASGYNATSDPPAPAVEKRPASANLTTASKVKEESESGSSDEEESENGSSDEEEVKVFRVLPSVPPTKQRGSTIAKKTREKGKSQQKSTPVRCTICMMILSSNYLKFHMRKHTGDHRYRCANCKRSFWNWNTFWNHKKQMALRNGFCPPVKKRDNTVAFVRWTEWKPRGEWKCKICGKRFKLATDYPSHMRGHRKENPYKCKDCGQAFSRCSNLYMHRRTHHSGVWQFNCIFCEKGFHRKINYWDHLRVHIKEKPCFCVVDGCKASFTTNKSLSQHRRSVHLKKMRCTCRMWR